MERPELAVFRAPVIHSKHETPPEIPRPIPLPLHQSFNDSLSLYSYYLSQLMVAQRAAAAAAAVSALASYPPAPILDPQTAAAVLLSQNHQNLNILQEKVERNCSDWETVSRSSRQRTLSGGTDNSKHSWINYYEKSLKSVNSSPVYGGIKSLVDANNNTTEVSFLYRIKCIKLL